MHIGDDDCDMISSRSLKREDWRRRPGEVDKIEIAYSRREEVRDGYG